MTHHFHPSILREYDIRGIVGKTLTAADAYAIGRSFASFRKEWQDCPPRIAIGCDGRLSSPELTDALAQGLRESGAQVIRLPAGPTPMLYYAVSAQQHEGGIMVTGSHNPPSHNGFKFMLGKKPFYGKDIKALGEIAAQARFHSGNGSEQPEDIRQAYVSKLAGAYSGKRPLRIAWDAGNGAAGEIVERLAQQLPGTHATLFTDIDGRFPNHHPDPSVATNLSDLIRTVREQHCDVGIAFDGDGDRIGVVDETGDIIWGDQLLAIYANDLLKRHPGATVIADVKASQTLFDAIARMGGAPLMWKTGHSHIKSKMVETGALLAGEMSGHMFFAEDYYGYDDGLYAAVRLLSILAGQDRKLSELRKLLPPTFATPELRIDCEEARKFAIVDAVKERLAASGATMSDVDGVRVSTPDGWWLLRASNTQAALVARCESTTKDGLERLTINLSAELEGHGIKLAA